MMTQSDKLHQEMKKIRIYLDNCCFNRPYDNQTYQIIRLETEAKLYIQDRIKNEQTELVWSFILDFENSANPYKERRESIKEWQSISVEDIKAKEEIRIHAKELETSYGIKSKDSLHLACAVEAKSEYFLTTDKILIKQTGNLKKVKVVNPIEFIMLCEEKRELTQ